MRAAQEGAHGTPHPPPGALSLPGGPLAASPRPPGALGGPPALGRFRSPPCPAGRGPAGRGPLALGGRTAPGFGSRAGATAGGGGDALASTHSALDAPPRDRAHERLGLGHGIGGLAAVPPPPGGRRAGRLDPDALCQWG